MSKFFFSNEEIKEMPEPFKLPDISFIPGYRELKEEYDNLRYCIAIGRNQIYIDETFDKYILSSFKIFHIQLEEAYQNIINKHKTVAIVLLVFFILIILFNSLVVIILFLGRKVYEDEVDTYKLENILYKFI